MMPRAVGKRSAQADGRIKMAIMIVQHTDPLQAVGGNDLLKGRWPVTAQ